MKSTYTILLAALLLVGCASRGTVPVEEVHDAVTLMAVETKTYIAMSDVSDTQKKRFHYVVEKALVRLNEGGSINVRDGETARDLDTLATLYEEFVKNDESLDDWQRTQRLRTPELLRVLIGRQEE